MKKIIAGLCIMAASTTAFAQDGGKTRNWSFGTSLLPIFQSNSEIGVSLKRYIGGAQPKGAIRLYTSYRSSTDEANNQKNNSTEFKLHLGYQWMKHEGKFSFNYGADVALGIKNTENDYGGTDPYKTEAGSTGVKLFLGAAYSINNHLSLSTELGKLLAGQNTKVTATPNSVVVEHKGSIDDFFIGQLLMLNYHF